MLPLDARGAGIWGAKIWGAGLLLLLALAAAMMQVIPTPIAILLTLWLVLSVPLGIVVGHCALGED